MRALLLVALVVLAACRKDVQAPPFVPAEVIEVPVPTYVPIPDDLTAPCPWERDVPPSKSIKAARERAACLVIYEADREAIRKIEGQAVPEPTP